MSALVVDSVQKYFQNKPLLTDIYLKCESYQIVGLLGRNSSGKSTLLNIIFGQESCSNKFVSVDQQLIRTVLDSRKLINFLPQNSFLPNGLKIHECIKLFCNKLEQTILFQNQFILSLGNIAVGKLSTGQRKLFELILILHSKTPYLLLDEPFIGLSPINIEFATQLIVKSSQSGKGIILTDHAYETVLSISDKVYLLSQGSLKVINSKEELVDWAYIN